MPNALILSFVEWTGGFQRPQHLAVGLARRGWGATYACFDWLHRRGGRQAPLESLPEGLRVIQTPALPGANRCRLIDAFNRAVLRQRLARLGKWDLVIFNDPRLAGVAAALPAHRRVFDCMDDLSAADPNRDWRGAEAAALETAGRVWTGTSLLAERLAGRHPHVHFIPCGVDAAHFGAPRPADIDRARAEQPPGEGPVAGYFGVLNERFDVKRVEALLETGWRVVLIGPETSRAPRLPGTPRLTWLGPRPYAQLPGYLATWDAALIPYDTSGPHRFLYPVKALEYLAGGKPVIATPLPDIVRFLGNFVKLADTPEAWGGAARWIVEHPGEARAQAEAGRAAAAARSWDRMVGDMLADAEAGEDAS